MVKIEVGRTIFSITSRGILFVHATIIPNMPAFFLKAESLPASFTRTCWNVGMVLGRYFRKWFKHVLTVSQCTVRSFDCHKIKNRKQSWSWNVHYSLPYMFYFTFVLPDLS